jgi:hypothetical protein
MITNYKTIGVTLISPTHDFLIFRAWDVAAKRWDTGPMDCLCASDGSEDAAWKQIENAILAGRENGSLIASTVEWTWNADYHQISAAAWLRHAVCRWTMTALLAARAANCMADIESAVQTMRHALHGRWHAEWEGRMTSASGKRISNVCSEITKTLSEKKRRFSA